MSDHKLKLTFVEGTVYGTLICPESGCEPATYCVECHAYIDDVVERCPECPSGDGECWIKSWADNVDLVEYASGGSVTVPIEVEWDGEAPDVTVGGVS